MISLLLPHLRRCRSSRWPAAAAIAVVLLSVGNDTEARRPPTVTNVEVIQEDNGTTVIHLESNHAFPPNGHFVRRVARETPRGIVRITGMAGYEGPRVLDVGDGNVARLRISHGDRGPGPELTVVVEMESTKAHITSTTAEGHRFEIRVAGAAPAKPAAATPTPTATAPPTPTPTPTPTATWTPTGMPTATATATATTTATTTANAYPTRTPTATQAPKRSRRRAATPPAATSGSGPAAIYELPPGTWEPPPTTGPTVVEVVAIEEIVVSRRANGTTLVRITVTGEIAGRQLRHRRDPADPARHVLVILGLDVTQAPRTFATTDATVVGVGLESVAGFDLPVAEIRLELASSSVQVGQIATGGPHLVIELLPPQ